jgi:hypothetical protein
MPLSQTIRRITSLQLSEPGTRDDVVARGALQGICADRLLTSTDRTGHQVADHVSSEESCWYDGEQPHRGLELDYSACVPSRGGEANL